MEELKNTKQVSELITETTNLTGAGAITLQGDKLIELSLRFAKKSEAENNVTHVTRTHGSASYRVDKNGGEAEKISISINDIASEYRNEVREELNRLLDKYDSVTVINEEA